MKVYPPILTPAQARTLSNDEETSLLDSITSVNEQLADFDGTPITISIPASSNRVRVMLIEKIRYSGWQLPNGSDPLLPNAVSAVSGGPYRTSDYNASPEMKITLTERKQ